MPCYSRANQPMVIGHLAQGLVGRASAQCGEGSPEQWCPSNPLTGKMHKKVGKAAGKGPMPGVGGPFIMLVSAPHVSGMGVHASS